MSPEIFCGIEQEEKGIDFKPLFENSDESQNKHKYKCQFQLAKTIVDGRIDNQIFGVNVY